MTTLADKFLNDWAKDYEDSEGGIDQPDFSNIEKACTDEKRITHYVFDDGSVIITVDSAMNKRQWIHYESEQEMEEEWGDYDSDNYAIVDVFNL